MSENSNENLQAKEQTQKTDFMSYYDMHFFSEIIIRVIFGFTLLTMIYSSKPINQLMMTRLFIVYCLYRIGINAYYMFTFTPKNPKHDRTFYYELLYYSTLLLLVIAIHFTIKAKIPSMFLAIFTIPFIVVCFLKLAIGQFEEITYIQTPIFHFLESLQILFILLKLTYAETMPKWYLILSFYILLSLVLLLVALVLSIVFVVTFICQLIGLEFVQKNHRGWVILGLSYPIITKIVTNFLLLMSFWLCVERDLVGLNPDADLPDELVFRTAYVFIILNIGVIIIWFLFKQLMGVAPYDFYELGIKEDISKNKIYWRFKNEENKKEEENQLIDDEANKI